MLKRSASALICTTLLAVFFSIFPHSLVEASSSNEVPNYSQSSSNDALPDMADPNLHDAIMKMDQYVLFTGDGYVVSREFNPQKMGIDKST